MLQKNIDLELQALRLVQQQLGHSPEAYEPGGNGQEAREKTRQSRKETEEEDEKILREVLEQSKKDYERQKSFDEEEMQKRLTFAKQESLKLFEVSQREGQELANSLQKKLKVNSSEEDGGEAQKNLEEDKDVSSKSLLGESASKEDQKKAKPKEESFPSLTSKHKSLGKGTDRVSDAASLWLESAKTDTGNITASTGSKTTVSTELWCLPEEGGRKGREREKAG